MFVGDQQSNPVRGDANWCNPGLGSEHWPIDVECEPDHLYSDPAHEGDPQLIADHNFFFKCNLLFSVGNV